MEATYGDREHADPGPVDEMLAAIVRETAARGGNVVIPVFALERAQELLFYLGGLVRARRIPRLPVYLDSPMAIEVTRVFARYPSSLDPEAAALVGGGRAPFDFPGLRFPTTIEESKAINRSPGPCIILAGSGMCTGGRIKHHLQFNLPRRESTIVFVGYQAVGTLGRLIVDGAKEVRVLGEMVSINASIARLEGLSGHADREDLIQWLSGIKEAPREAFVTHGEPAVSQSFAALLRERKGWNVRVPEYLEEAEL